MIEIKDLSFSYENYKATTRFELNVPSWNIAKGEFISLLGPNGCGKSTLLRLIAGLSFPQKDAIKINGKDILELSRKELSKKIAYVPQTSNSVFPFSVYEVVMMGRTPYLNFMGFEDSNDQRIVHEVLEIMQVEHLKNKGINEISGGEAQRVFIARALAQKSEIILLDEPNAHLDLEHQIMIFDILKKINQENGITIATVSHDLNLVGIYTNKVALMIDGKIIMEGNKTDILKEKNIKKIFKISSKIFTNEHTDKMNVLISPLYS
jgi:iron complex transport system ATP-binding protein